MNPDQIKTAKRLEESADLYAELDENPLPDYSKALYLYLENNSTEDALRIAKKLEEIADTKEEKGETPLPLYFKANSVYAELASTEDLERLNKKFENHPSAQALEKKLQTILQNKKREHNEDYIRLQKAHKEYVERSEKEKKETMERASQSLTSKLLETLDNFELTLKAMEKYDDKTKLKEGTEMIYKQIHKILKMEGLERIQSINQPFDPSKHNAIAYKESTKPQDTVVEELKPGYTFKGKLIRAAQVILSQETKKGSE